MPLDTIEEGKQQYTLKVMDRETGQETLCSYNASPILTTDHDELVQYAARMAVHHGKNKIYTVCFVTPIHMSPLDTVQGTEENMQYTAVSRTNVTVVTPALPTEHSNMQGIEYKPDDGNEPVLKLSGGMREIPIERKPVDFSDDED